MSLKLDLIEKFSPYVLGTLGTIGAYLIGTKERKSKLKKESTETQHSHLENVESALKIYRDMLDRLKTDLIEAEKMYEIAMMKINSLKKENSRLLLKNTKLEKAIIDCNAEACKSFSKK